MLKGFKETSVEKMSRFLEIFMAWCHLFSAFIYLLCKSGIFQKLEVNLKVSYHAELFTVQHRVWPLFV